MTEQLEQIKNELTVLSDPLMFGIELFDIKNKKGKVRRKGEIDPIMLSPGSEALKQNFYNKVPLPNGIPFEVNLPSDDVSISDVEKRLKSDTLIAETRLKAETDAIRAQEKSVFANDVLTRAEAKIKKEKSTGMSTEFKKLFDDKDIVDLRTAAKDATEEATKRKASKDYYFSDKYEADLNDKVEKNKSFKFFTNLNKYAYFRTAYTSNATAEWMQGTDKHQFGVILDFSQDEFVNISDKFNVIFIPYAKFQKFLTRETTFPSSSKYNYSQIWDILTKEDKSRVQHFVKSGDTSGPTKSMRPEENKDSEFENERLENERLVKERLEKRNKKKQAAGLGSFQKKRLSKSKSRQKRKSRQKTRSRRKSRQSKRLHSKKKKTKNKKKKQKS